MQNTEYLSFYLLRKANSGKRMFHVLLSFRTDVNGPKKYCLSNSDTLKTFSRAKGNAMYI